MPEKEVAVTFVPMQKTVYVLEETRMLEAIAGHFGNGIQALPRLGGLRQKVRDLMEHANLERAVELGLRSGLGDEWIRLGGVKLFADGALGPRTAWMEEPYENDPGHCGMPLQPRAELEAALAKVDVPPRVFVKERLFEHLKNIFGRDVEILVNTA